MNEQRVLEILKSVGAIITDGHFVYTSGKHGPVYVNKDALLMHPHITSQVCTALAWQFMYDSVDVVIAPAIGGVILASHTALHLKVLSAYAEKDGDGGFVIKRGYDTLVSDNNVLVVEDIINTGGSVKKVVDAVRRHGGTVVGVGALCNRGGVTAEDLKVPKLKSLVNMPLEVYDESECPLCVSGVPINTELGKGREYLVRNRK